MNNIFATNHKIQTLNSHKEILPNQTLKSTNKDKEPNNYVENCATHKRGLLLLMKIGKQVFKSRGLPQ